MKDIQTESMKLQWNFYERTINNYSIIMRIMQSAEEDLLISHVPRIFVEESFFDVCKIMVDEDGIIREGFYSIDETLNSLDYASVAAFNGSSATASLGLWMMSSGTVFSTYTPSGESSGRSGISCSARGTG